MCFDKLSMAGRIFETSIRRTNIQASFEGKMPRTAHVPAIYAKRVHFAPDSLSTSRQ
jgi:hypothetical protein